MACHVFDTQIEPRGSDQEGEQFFC